MTERAQDSSRPPLRGSHHPAFYCPYCGDEDLRPHDEGAWLCAACRRVFTVQLLGLNFPEGMR